MLSEAYEREWESRRTGRFDRDTYVSREPATTEAGYPARDTGHTAVSGRPPASRGDVPPSPPR